MISDIPKEQISEIIVVDNASTDTTAVEALACGATVLKEPIPGYGRACLKGIEYLKRNESNTEIVVFLDGDYSDFPEEIPNLVLPILNGEADLVIGSRSLGRKEKGSMTLQQVFGNWLATFLLRLLYGAKFTDLGPFRAIRFSKLVEMNMQDNTFGWTVEMQLRAARSKMKYTEVPVSYRKRIGESKISGTVKGTIMAGYKILLTLFKYRL